MFQQQKYISKLGFHGLLSSKTDWWVSHPSQKCAQVNGGCIDGARNCVIYPLPMVWCGLGSWFQTRDVNGQGSPTKSQQNRSGLGLNGCHFSRYYPHQNAYMYISRIDFRLNISKNCWNIEVQCKKKALRRSWPTVTTGKNHSKHPSSGLRDW